MHTPTPKPPHTAQPNFRSPLRHIRDVAMNFSTWAIFQPASCVPLNRAARSSKVRPVANAYSISL